MKLRVNWIDDETTPRELKKLFAKHGRVEEVAIYVGGKVAYGIVTMPDDDAERLMDDRPQLLWRERILDVTIANRSRGPWLSPEWRPPQQNWYR